MQKKKIKLWRDTMNITKVCLISILLFFTTGCSIYPWKTIKFISYPVEKYVEIKSFDINEKNNLDENCLMENVFFYFVTNGIEDTMYTTKSPFAINFVVSSFEKNTVITINSIMIKFDGKKVMADGETYPIKVLIAYPGYPNPELYFGHYETNYVYELQKINEISVTVNVTINKNGIDITKDLKASAMKKEKRGLFAWRY